MSKHRGRPAGSTNKPKDIAEKCDDKKLIAKLKSLYDLCKTYYEPYFKKMRLLDAVDSGELWKSMKLKFPTYQILPDTNWVNYIKSNLLASIYTITKSANILPTSEEDKELITKLNIAMDRIWSLADVGKYQYLAGERAALLNIGITQVGWDEHLTGGCGSTFYKGNVTLKNIDPIHFMRDPFATDLETSGYCMTYENLHKSVFEENPNYKDTFKEFLEKHKGMGTEVIPTMDTAVDKSSQQKDYYTLFTYFVKKDNKINEYHVINNEYLLYKKEGILPNVFPFVILYCNAPANKLIGQSECAKVFANNLAYNLLDSIAMTSEYKNQRPPKFISSSSGLNIRQFARHGDEADKAFVVNGDASRAVHYQTFPQTSSGLINLKSSLTNAIQTTTGIDGRYSGRDTGSVTTTGGVEQMLDRASMIDAPKIIEYESYTKRLTQLILSNMLEFAPNRKYFVKKPQSTKYMTVEIPFQKIDSSTLFDYSISISSELPSTKQRLAQVANTLMEKQMQYQQEGGDNVDLLTTEEWLMFQDFPIKEYMLERMGMQRMTDALAETSQVLTQYAELIKQGMDPEEAMYSTASSLRDKRQGIEPPEEIVPTVAPAGAPQPPQQMPMMQ